MYSFPNEQPYRFLRALGYQEDFIRGYELYVIDGTAYAYMKTGFRHLLFDIKFDIKLIK